MKAVITLISLASLSGAVLAQLSAPSSLPGQNGSVPILQAPPAALPMPAMKPWRQPQNPAADLSMPAYSPPLGTSASNTSPSNTSPPNASPGSEPLPATIQRLSPRMPGVGKSEAAPAVKKLPANLATQVSTGKKLQFRKTPMKASFEVTSGAPPSVDVARVNQSLAARFQSIALDESDRAALKLDVVAFSQQPSEKIQASQRIGASKMMQSKTLMGQPAQPAPPDFGAKSDGRMTAQMNPEVWCERFANREPRVSRVLVDADNLAPGMSFVLKGVCLGDKPGLIDVRFQGESNKVYRANVQNWGHNKILATLPENIEGVPPTIVEIIVTTAGNRVATPGNYTFVPKWELVSVLHHFSRVVACTGDPRYPYTHSRCSAYKGTFQSHGFTKPDDCRGVCIDLLPSFGADGISPELSAELRAIRYTEEDLTIAPERGADRWAFDLPPYAILKSWWVDQESFDHAKSTVRTVWDPTTNQIVANWSMGEIGEQGFLGYTIYGVSAWIPVGMPLKRLPY